MRYRSAITGKFVTAKYAKQHPKTTVGEKMKRRVGKWLKRARNR